MINCSLFLSLSLSIYIVFPPPSLSSLSCYHFVARFVNITYVVFSKPTSLTYAV